MKYIASIEGREYTIEIVDDKHIRVGERLMEVDFDSVSGQPIYSLIVDGKSYESFIYPGDDRDWQVMLQGRQFPVTVEDEREKRLRVAGGGQVAEGAEYQMKAPMPGLVVSVLVEEGQKVEKGQLIIVLESMKMQNELKSPRSGTIGRIRVKARETVDQRQTLLSVL
ncbi:MAG TPA: biotin/lipoyl-containing protein [Anaerolineales bacterium]